MITKDDIGKFVKFLQPVEPCPVESIAEIKNIDLNPNNSQESIIVQVHKLGIFVRFDSQDEFEEKTKIIEVEYCEHCGNIKGEMKYKD